MGNYITLFERSKDKKLLVKELNGYIRACGILFGYENTIHHLDPLTPSYGIKKIFRQTYSVLIHFCTLVGHSSAQLSVLKLWQ